MTESEEDDFAFFGTPLEQYEEDSIPRKKPLTIQDQIATDKHGRRRFHGAFTGGFSAGFYNTVGSLEGWTPSSFKSSREQKANSKFQKPEDFMDEEDLEEFGIAPTVVRAKPEYSGDSKAQKRERVQFSEGPIPGEPVLNCILQPARETVGVLLLMKMGWKPGQGIGPKLTLLQKKKQSARNRIKIYGCSLPNQAADSDEDEIDENIADPNLLFAPEEHEIHFLHPKTNTFGMGYSGLDKTSVLSLNSTLKSETFKMFENNKKLAIKGQAFGVGAFEEDDADIYAREDMSQYDFALETTSSLREKRRKEKEANRLLAITNSDKIIEGFVEAHNPMPAKKFFRPPDLPNDYEPLHPKRKTRFNSQIASLNDQLQIKGKHFITADDRASILGEKRPNNITKESGVEKHIADNIAHDPLQGFRPFLADPEKQERYEKYLHFIKIGAKDAFSSVQPKSMSDWEREREKDEFEQASRLYKPLSGMMAERFAHGELPEDTMDPLSAIPRTNNEDDQSMIQAAKAKMFGKLTRRIFDWAPCSLLCKRMNIAEPQNGGGVSLSEVANNKKQTRSKFSVFNFLETSQGNSFEDKSDKQENITESQSEKREETDDEVKETEKKSSLFLPKPVIEFEEPMEKKDLFKAIFCSDEEGSDDGDDNKESGENERSAPTTQPLTLANALRNTSPPRGIFANLDLDAINKRKTVTPDPPVLPINSKDAENEKKVEKITVDDDSSSIYGPLLPSKPVFSAKYREVVNIRTSSESSSDNVWVERSEESDKKKQHKKHKKNKIKKKHKSKHKKKH